MTQDPPQISGSLFTVYDPFAEALYCRPTFEAARQAADKIGCSLIVELEGDDPLDPGAVRSRYRKVEGGWITENELNEIERHISEQSKRAFRVSDPDLEQRYIEQVKGLKEASDDLNRALLPEFKNE